MNPGRWNGPPLIYHETYPNAELQLNDIQRVLSCLYQNHYTLEGW